MARIRVLVVDDHTVVRAGIRLLLESETDIKVVGEAKDGQEAVDKVQQLAPDVVLMDLAMAGMSGLEATRRMTRQWPDVRVLVLTMHDNDEYFFQALKAGASGYLLKESSPDELVAALRAVHEGGVFIYPSLASRLLDDYLRRVDAGEETKGLSELTTREQEILRLIAEGKTGREIARALHVSPKTVDRHRANMMRKLDLHNRAELIRYAIRKGLIEA